MTIIDLVLKPVTMLTEEFDFLTWLIQEPIETYFITGEMNTAAASKLIGALMFTIMGTLTALKLMEFAAEEDALNIANGEPENSTGALVISQFKKLLKIK